MRVIWTSRAKNDLLGILDYLKEEWSYDVADDFNLQTEKICEHISRHPFMFPAVNKKRKNLRSVSVTKHNRLYYEIGKGVITIITIFGVGQHPNKLKLK